MVQGLTCLKRQSWSVGKHTEKCSEHHCAHTRIPTSAMEWGYEYVHAKQIWSAKEAVYEKTSSQKGNCNKLVKGWRESWESLHSQDSMFKWALLSEMHFIFPGNHLGLAYKHILRRAWRPFGWSSAYPRIWSGQVTSLQKQPSTRLWKCLFLLLRRGHCLAELPFPAPG